jgi:hypothetical protein
MASVARTDTAADEPTPTPGTTVLSGPPGPVGRTVEWLLARPWRGALVVVGLFIGQAVWAYAWLWSGDRVAAGTFDWTALVLAVYAPTALGGAAIGLHIARRGLAAFWPATGWPDTERADWARRFMATPARYEWAALLIGGVGGVLALAAAPASVLGPATGRLLVYVAYAPPFLLGYSLSLVGLVITVRWLRLIAQIHREARAIDPFDRAPLYAFSRVTAIIGLTYAAVAYYSFTVNGAFQAGNLPSLAFLGASTVFGVVAFVAPLWGIHNRLVREKDRLLLDVERRVTRLAAELYARIDAGDFAATAPLNATMSGLTTLRERVSRLPTWPWAPQLLRGFVSALLLPLVVFLLTRVASNLLGT